MKLNRLFLLCFSLIAATFVSCDDDFDPNGEYRETAIVYTLLDASQPVQYVKVNKAYLNTNSDALVIAANNPDSAQFYDPIEVRIEKLKLVLRDTTVQNTFILSPVTITNKEAGDFYYPEQIVYASQPNEIVMAGKELFRVVITNQASGKVYSGITEIVSPLCVTRVGYNIGTDLNCGGTTTPQAIIPYLPLTLSFNLVPNAPIYKAAYQINYMEITGADTVHKSTDYSVIPNLVLSGTDRSERLDAYVLFNHLNTVINTANDAPELIRKFTPGNAVVVEVTAGGSELQKYIQVNNTYSAVTQARPFYSNVSNGAGLISSRFSRRVPGFIAGDTAIKALTTLYPHLKFEN